MQCLPVHLREESAVAKAAALRAIGVYALYRLHATVSHSAVPRADSDGMFGEFVREGIRGLRGPQRSW